MSRIEASIRSPLSFRRNMSEGVAQYDEAPETVGITFDGRLFVWHAFPEDEEEEPVFGSTPLGPSVTSALGDDTSDVVATELERLLSALTYLYDVSTEVTHYGSSWETDAFKPPYTRGPKVPGWARKEPVDSISLRRDSEGLLKALGWYREGKNAGSPYYRFLAHWNALEAVCYGPTSRSARAELIDRMTPALAEAWTAYPLPESPSEHFDEASRNAIAHVFRGEGGARPLIDPDADADRQRLDWESRFVEVLVPHAIREVFGEPVSVEFRRAPN
jgi:hypothetical protein